MIQHGTFPFLECSSAGDKRFSAFYANVRCLGNLTIEELYQGAKTIDGRAGHSVKFAKGKKPENEEFCRSYYSLLWELYMDENPQLYPVLEEATGLSDKFGQPGHVCQATELWWIREQRKKFRDLDIF